MSGTTCELHHTAYRVADIQKSVSDWSFRFGARIELPPTLVTADQVLVAFLVFHGGRIELVQSVRSPTNTKAPGRPDHICLLCKDFDRRIARVEAEGGIIARPPVPTEAFAMRRMCFILYRDIGLVELVES
jgi:catechol 2,3-dioxygenase-like lactoylglutathione lyase family enzyme